MNKNLLQIFRSFEKTFRCYEGEPAASDGGAGSSAAVATESGPEGDDDGGVETGGGDTTSGKETQAEPTELDSYRGSEKVNPKQRPLRNIVRKGMSKEQIDSLILDAGAQIFMTEEEIAAAGVSEKEAVEKNDGKEDQEKIADNKEKKTPEQEEQETEDFLKDNDLTKEEFLELPKKAQDRLEKLYTEHKATSQTYRELEEKHTKLSGDADTLMKDSFVAARAEELRTGRAYIARQLKPITMAETEEIENILTNDGRDAATKKINDLIQKRAGDAIAHERSVADKKSLERELHGNTWDTIKEMGKIDKRLAIKEADRSKIDGNAKHPEFKMYSEIVDFMVRNKMTHEQVKTCGPKKIYALIASEKGWTQEAMQRVAQDTKKSIAERLANPQKARTVDPGKGSSESRSGSPTGFSKEALIDHIAKTGDSSVLDNLRKVADANMDRSRIAEIGMILAEGERRYNERKNR